MFDEIEAAEDRRFIRRMEAYFSKTAVGRYRSRWVVPAPFFVSSEMTCCVQAADVCIYCINWGFRLPGIGMNAECRDEIATVFGPWLKRMQYQGQGYRDGEVFDTYGIFFVPDLFASRK